jgi:hypothetical protein
MIENIPAETTKAATLTDEEMLSAVREAYQGSGEGYDFRSVHASQGEDFDRWMATREAAVLNEAADAIQALHPGEVKASVVFLRERAAAVLSAAGV